MKHGPYSKVYKELDAHKRRIIAAHPEYLKKKEQVSVAFNNSDPY